MTLFLTTLFLVMDLYLYKGLRIIFTKRQKVFIAVFWGFSILTLAALALYQFGGTWVISRNLKTILMVFVFMAFISKATAIIFLMGDDVRRGIVWINRHLGKNPQPLAGKPITRSEFLSKTAMVAGTLPFFTLSFGILSGAHDYRVRKHILYLPHLPKSWDGVVIAQISDIHAGSFFNKTAVRGGVDLLMEQKPDMVFFTGDLVNNKSEELHAYFEVFKKVKAPLGVYATTGNHDYGDYAWWPSEAAKAKNFKDLKAGHKALGWDLLMNESRILKEGGEPLAIAGVENWGKGRFPKYGNLDAAMEGIDDAPVKLLLSHDPSHWDLQVRPEYPAIDLMMAGHTHGFQFGIEWGSIRWSPSQYAYDQWAGMYRKGNQFLYVNRGYGYIGYPGRIGIPPEITLLTLKRGNRDDTVLS